MFSKKPAIPKAPWAVRVLTPDFLIDGQVDTEAHPESWEFFSPSVSRNDSGLLWLNAPRFTATSANSGAAPAVSTWVVPLSGGVVAVLPFDNASLAEMQKNVADFNHPYPALLHVGPFAIRGQLLSEFDKAADVSNMAGYHSLAVANAEIEYRLPGAAFTGLKSPLMLVHMRRLQGFALTA